MISEQFRTRKKYKRVRCPECNAMSKVCSETTGGWQKRECRNGHIFDYDYTCQAIAQYEGNYKSNTVKK